MKPIFIILICAFVLVGCNHKKSQEQISKENAYWQTCGYDHMQDGNFDVCKKKFEKKFGHPYKPPLKN